MKAHLVLYIEINEPNASAWFKEAKRIIDNMDTMVIHAETIDQEISIGGPSS